MEVTTMATEPTVFVVDDDEAVRDSVSWLIQSIGVNVKTYSSANAFLLDYDPGIPGCIILDVRMPGMSGLDLHEKLMGYELSNPIIYITGHGDVPMAVRAMKAGAVDFIGKPFNDQALLDRVQQAIDRDTQNRADKHKRLEIKARWKRLTPREREVMEMVIAGKSNKTIAAQLGVSSKTVEAHRAKFMEKMQASSLPDLMRITLSNGIAKTPD
jgi:RNA polymerase sigma factor (sigma-70 family)